MIFFKSTNQKQELPVAAMFVNGSARTKCAIFMKDLPLMLSTKLKCHFIWLSGFQRRRVKCEKLTDDGRQVMAKAHIAFGKVS